MKMRHRMMCYSLALYHSFAMQAEWALENGLYGLARVNRLLSDAALKDALEWAGGVE